MLGALAGDIIGSVYEWNNIKTTKFPLFKEGCEFTDDSVLTVALAESILGETDYTVKLREYFGYYPDAGYGGAFTQWAASADAVPYNSWGNGSAMRVSPVGFAYDSLDRVLTEAKKSAVVTHNHPEGIRGAQATAAAIYLARTGRTKLEIKVYVEETFDYNLDESIDSVREWYEYDVSCQGTVPHSIRAFLEANDFEDAIRKAISIGGDSDTLACITGGIAQAFYGGVPKNIKTGVYSVLDKRLRDVLDRFNETFSVKI